MLSSNEILQSQDLDAPLRGELGLDWPGEPITDLRWVALHLIEETARHAGHLDAARELIDGATGRGPRLAEGKRPCPSVRVEGCDTQPACHHGHLRWQGLIRWANDHLFRGSVGVEHGVEFGGEGLRFASLAVLAA